MPPGRYGAVHAALAGTREKNIQRCQRRQDAARLRKMREEELRKRKEVSVQKVMEAYDLNKSGKLEKEQLKAVISRLNEEEVDDREVQWLMATCDADNDGGIDKKELYTALSWWEHYQLSKPRLQELLKQFDFDGTGLALNNLQKMLTHLNDDQFVDTKEAETILNMCDSSQTGSLNANELMYAISVWYASHDDLSRVELASVPSPPKQSVIDEARRASIDSHTPTPRRTNKPVPPTAKGSKQQQGGCCSSCNVM
eukprot:TRINITY_DN12201_c0_g1_i1.p1 TRINITY_DN12201_c0_g1~~TRINITY_DN12201_c0_g1_i1.p1  ORF type:complete len:255 (+),score=81.63 TRINITY_DN12201_c0_g1_i1:49-813(+)